MTKTTDQGKETKKAPKSAAKSAAAPKATAPKAKPAAKPKASKASGQTLTVTQTGSPIGRQGYQRDTLIGLGLNKIGRTRTLEDTPSVRGMVNSVKHLVRIEEAA